MQTVSYHLQDNQVKAIEQISKESKLLTDVPDLSKSEVARRIISLGLSASEEITELVGEATRIKLRQEQYMENEGWLRNQRSGFRTQVERHFKTRFENGYNPEEIETFADNMRMKARFYWPEDIGDDYSEEREQALDYVNRVAESAKEASQNSDYDPLDPNGIFSDYEGVERGRDKAEVEAEITEHVEEARDLITDDIGGRLGDGATEPEQVIEILSNRSDIPDGSAEQIVEQALEVIEGDASIEEIEETTEEQRSSTSTETTEEATEEEIEADGGIGHDPEEAEAMGTARRLVEQGLTSIRKISERLTSEYDLDPEEATQIAGDAVNRESSTSTTETGRDLDHRAGDRAATDGGGDR